MKKLIKLLGLKPLEGQTEVSEDQICAAVQALEEAATSNTETQKQAAKINKLLELAEEATLADVIAAITALKKSANTPTAAREIAIRKKMELTGMSRTDAEHVVDQQSKEDAARAKSKKK